MARGDSAAVAGLYDLTRAAVFGLALRILRDPALAEDVCVEVYVQAWRGAAGYDAGRSGPIAWLMMLTRARAIDELRRGRRSPACDDGAVPASGLDEQPEAALLAAEQRMQVRRALAKLPEEQRAALELAYFGGLSHAEIAQRLETPLGTVKTRIRSAMLRLRTELREWHEAGSSRTNQGAQS